MTLFCYNRGCGAKFEAEGNTNDACRHHPGVPVFHDAYKGWSCCKKRSTDFTEFLNIPGCTKGLHNPEKPPEPKKKVEKPLEKGEIIEDGPKLMTQKAPTTIIERPSDDLPKIKLRVIIASSLKMALQKHKDKIEKQKEELISNQDDKVQVGASCKHNGCDVKYLSDDSNNSECVFHPGNPVFHEGYKYWTCCNKRTSDFQEFLKQGGCDSGKHEWMKPSEIAEKKSTCSGHCVNAYKEFSTDDIKKGLSSDKWPLQISKLQFDYRNCSDFFNRTTIGGWIQDFRYDWHQTSKHVLVSVYAKVCDPEKCDVEANATNVSASISFNGGVNVFELLLKLNGVIVPEKSSVEYMGTKAELKLAKRDPFSWPKLELVEE